MDILRFIDYSPQRVMEMNMMQRGAVRSHADTIGFGLGDVKEYLICCSKSKEKKLNLKPDPHRSRHDPHHSHRDN